MQSFKESLFLESSMEEKTKISTSPKETLLGKTLDELQEIASNAGMPGFTAKQMAEWIYKKRVRSIDEMTNLSLRHRKMLQDHYCIGAADPVDAQRSVDGTIKYLYRVEGSFLHTENYPSSSPSPSLPSPSPTVSPKSGLNPDGKRYVESVFIPDDDRATLCVSSQVGCKMGCAFCMTGRQGFNAHLTAAEILNQIYSLPEADRLTNLVFMGMGEPMDNIDAVLRALTVLTAPWGYGWSPRRITVSTVGIRKGLMRFLQESDCHLAVSLHSPIPIQRASLMPAEKAFPAKELVETLKNYDWSGQRRLSFEYIVFQGINDSPAHLKELIRLLRGLDCRINLIRFHSIPDSPLKGADSDTMLRVRDYLTTHGLFSTIRASRGEDIFAACGMLSTKKKQEENTAGQE